MGRGFRILSDRSGTVRESQSPLVKFRNKAFTGGTSLLPEALFNADSLRKAQDPVIFLRCHCAIECFNICHLRKRCILIHNANIDMIPVGLMEIPQDLLGVFRLSRQEQMAEHNAILKYQDERPLYRYLLGKPVPAHKNLFLLQSL